LNRGLERCERPEDRTLVREYLAALAPLLAGATLGENILPNLEGLAKWRQFKSEYERGFFGAMTVNERLFAMGLLQSYDRALNEGDTGGLSRRY